MKVEAGEDGWQQAGKEPVEEAAAAAAATHNGSHCHRQVTDSQQQRELIYSSRLTNISN